MATLLTTQFGKVLSTDIQENHLIFNVALNPQHTIYRGHFPDKPIMPGVCTLQLTKELLTLHFNQKLQLIKADNLKFSGMIEPTQVEYITFLIQLLPNNSPDKIAVKTSIESANGLVFCKFSGEYLKTSK